ncbi:MAG: alpha-galactosidase [Candidatus Binatia bacterium]|nr:alpha-galactosidase [Candidatus Binatia bacterium]
MRYEVRNGRWFFYSAEGAVRLEGLRPSVRYEIRGQPFSYRPLLHQGGNGVVRAASEQHGLSLEFTVRTEELFLVLYPRISNRGNETVHLQSVAPLWLPDFGEVCIGESARSWSVFRNGYQSWTGTRSFRAHEADPDPFSGLLKIGLIDIARPSTGTPGHFRSDVFTAIANLHSGEVLVVGFLDARFTFADIELAIVGERCGRWAATVHYESKPLPAGATVSVPPLALAVVPDAYSGLAAYAQRSGQHMGARVSERSPVGWCSWYEYFTEIDEGAIRDNIDAARNLRGVVTFDYLQVDDGYQATIGDWLLPNAKFPHGMARLANEIRSAGFAAGIWLAPFIAKRESRLFAEHPEWFVRNDDQRPRFALWNPMWGRTPCYALDTTHPAALEWIASVIDTLVRKWNFTVLKLDFLYAAALPGQRSDAGATRAEALRRGLETIRAAAGDNAFLIGCGCPLGPAVGIVDAMRIGPDVAPYWSNFLSRVPLRDLHGVATKHAVRNTLTRAFLHRRWWLNDPDCLMVRAQRTRLTEEEFRTLATAIVLTDGMLVLSDRLSHLTQRELERLRLILELQGDDRYQASLPNLMAADPPNILIARASDQFALALFNFDDLPSTRQATLSQWFAHGSKLAHAFEHWTGQVIELHNGGVTLPSVPPHGVRVLTLPAG